MSRYSRQISLPEIGISGQQKLQNASILCVGAGGLGCPALQYLAAAGVGHLGIIDPDNVDESNLQRQILFTMSDIGRNKAQAAKEHLLNTNPEISITAYETALSLDNVKTIFADYDIIIDATDNFSAKYLINDAAAKYKKISIYGSIQGFDGQLSTFYPDTAGCYRCLYPEPPKTPVANCAEAGVIGAIAGMIGVAQAMEAIKCILNHPNLPTMDGFLYILDMHHLDSQKLKIRANPHCPICAQHANDIELTNISTTCAIPTYITEITASELQKQENLILIDVREENEFANGAIIDAVCHPLSQIMDGDYPKYAFDADIILYCQKGMRSQQAGQILDKAGYHNIKSLAGGYEAYLEQHPNQTPE